MKTKLTKKVIEDYKQYLIEQEKSRATIEKYVRDVHKFYQFLGEDGELTKTVVCDYKAKLPEGYRISSANSMLAAVNSLLGFIGLSHFKVRQFRIQRQLFRSEERELNIRDYKKLLKAAGQKGDERLYLMMLTICSTGIRISELPFITREALAEGKAEVYCKSKNRIVLIPASLKKHLHTYAKKQDIKSGSLFITRTGQPVDRRNIWNQMKKNCQDCRC